MQTPKTGTLTDYLAEYEKPVTDRLLCEIKWGIINETASQADNHYTTSAQACELSNVYTPSESEKKAYMDADAINNQKLPQKRLATLEPDFWSLASDTPFLLKQTSGSAVTNKSDLGYVSSRLCDGNGNFGTFSENALYETDVVKPKIVMEFPKANLAEGRTVINLTGFNFNFFLVGREYPTLAQLVVERKTGPKIYANVRFSSCSEEKTFSECAFRSAATHAAVQEDFRFGILDVVKVTFVILRWSRGGRRARIDEMEFGTYRIYDNTTLIDVEENAVLDPVSGSLPISTLNFTVSDPDSLFDSENPNSLTQYLTQRQPVELSWFQRTARGEVRIDGGTYYLKEWNGSDNRREYKLGAETLLGFMEQPYYKGLYSSAGKSAKALIKELFEEIFPESSGLKGKLVIETALADTTIKSPLPLKLNNEPCTYKDCLMLLAQVLGATVTTNKEGAIWIRKLPTAVEQYTENGTAKPFAISLDKVFGTPPRSNLKSQLREIQVKYYTPNLNLSGESTLFEGKITPEAGKEYLIEFTKLGEISKFNIANAAWSSAICDADQYSQAVVLKNFKSPYIGTEISIKIEGQELINSCSVYSTGIIDNNISGEIVTIDCPIANTQAQAKKIAELFLQETRYRDQYELEIKRNLLYDCGDVVHVEKPLFGGGSTPVRCRIQEQKRSLTKAKHSVKLRKI